MKKVFQFVKPLLFETEGIQQRSAQSIVNRGSEHHVVAVKKDLSAKMIPDGSIVVTDHPARLGRDFHKVLSHIVDLLRRGCDVIVDDLTVMANSPEAMALARLFELRGKIKSARIKEGLWLTKKRGGSVGRKRINRNLVETFKAAKRAHGSLRTASEQLQAQGIEISKSALHKIIRQPDDGGDD